VTGSSFENWLKSRRDYKLEIFHQQKAGGRRKIPEGQNREGEELRKSRKPIIAPTKPTWLWCPCP
jgi:hypothetical protein